MADLGDADRGRRRRRRGGGGRRERGEREKDVGPATAKPPIILAKPPSERNQPTSDASASGSRPQEKTVVMLKTRDEPVRPASSSSPHSVTSSDSSSPGTPSYQLQRHPPTPTMGHVVIEGTSQSRLASPPEMFHVVRLVDESLQWCDQGMDVLQDQNDFMTIGVLGLQGCGKSFIQSLLAGSSTEENQRNFVFRPQSKEKCEIGAHQTTGMDMFVTSERLILLDTQPVLSASVLDHMIHHDKKYPAEFSTAENCLEMQSLHLATFLLTVCNVVIIVMDWFTDIHLLRLLQTAEMLKPATPSVSHESSTGLEDHAEFYPHIVFVLNKARREDFSVENFTSMQKYLNAMFHKSRLRYRGGVTLAEGTIIPGLNPQTCPSDVNLYLLPDKKNRQSNCDKMKTCLPDYKGHPDFETMFRSLRNQIFSLPRNLLTHTTLSEKNWFHYAARTWEAVKKSTLLSEYNRLLA